MIRVVFAIDGGDLSVATDMEATRQFEEYDVSEIDFFDQDGTVLRAVIAKGRVTSFVETGGDRLSELVSRLRDYLQVCHLDPALADDPVAAAQAIRDQAWSRRRFQRFSRLDRWINGARPQPLTQPG